MINFTGLDKAIAVRNALRTPEKWLFMISPAGGHFGVLLGMLVFHHKTRKTRFWLVTIMTLILHASALTVLTGL